MAIAVLSPHPDDAVLSCWHLLVSRFDALVVNIFTGTPKSPADLDHAWWDRLTGARDPAIRMRERIREDAEALKQAGREPINLGFLDAQYRVGEQPVEQIAKELGEVLPDSTHVYAPAGLGQVPDHDLVRDAAVVLEGRGYAISYYADLPHAIQFGWPSSVTGEPRQPGVDVDAYWKSKLARALRDARGLAVDLHVLDAAAQAAKLAAMGTYRTQLPSLLRLNPRLVDPATLRYEAIWRRK